MADKDLTPEKLRERLWSELAEARIVMLGLVGDEIHHMQPMAAFADPQDDAVWFFTKRQTDLVSDTGNHHDAMMCIMAKDMEFQACIHGILQPDHNMGKIDQFWSPFIAAWFPEGKNDPDLTLMRLDPQNARVWISNKGPILYPFEILKANIAHTLPNVGTKADVAM